MKVLKLNNVTGNSGQMLLPDLLRMENKTIGYKKGWLI